MRILAKRCALALLLLVATAVFAQSRRRAVAPPVPVEPPPAPVAVADSYTLTSATSPISITPGVLTNDTLNSGQIASYGVTGTEQTTIGQNTATARGGLVALHADGSFAYGPPQGFTGSDTFVYVLHNNGGNSSATVTLTAPVSTEPDFVVNSPGFFYTISGLSGQNPKITLTRGKTYRFQIDTDDVHPFEILDAPPGSVQNNNISFGVITFTVPATEKNYRYICSFHGFGNSITTTP